MGGENRVERKLVAVEMRGSCHAVIECMQWNVFGFDFFCEKFHFLSDEGED